MGTANTPDLAGHISKLGEMHEVLKGEIDAISLSTVLFSHTDELKIPELANAKTSKTMAPCRQSKPRRPHRNRPRKTPWLPQPSLRHAPTPRLEMPLSKRVGETSWISAS